MSDNRGRPGEAPQPRPGHIVDPATGGRGKLVSAAVRTTTGSERLLEASRGARASWPARITAPLSSPAKIPETAMEATLLILTAVF